jgi:hypothetical protein
LAISTARLPDIGTAPSHTPIAVCSQALLNVGDTQANWQRKLFKYGAGVIIGTHVLATILAVFVLALHAAHQPSGTSGALEGESSAAAHAPVVIIRGLLGFELVSLAIGFCVHQILHLTHACDRWAMSRLVAEVARSVQAFGGVHVYLEHLFALPFPAELRPLLRTINVLHLRSARTDKAPWEEKRKTYVEMRLTSPIGQIEYYTRNASRAAHWLKFYQWTFFVCSLGAILSTATKLALIHRDDEHVKAALGGLAIALPVLAVAALSLAAAMDLEARKHTYGEMLEFLHEQKNRLNQAPTERDFVRLLLETESRLLGETTNWHSRRSFTGVA